MLICKGCQSEEVYDVHGLPTCHDCGIVNIYQPRLLPDYVKPNQQARIMYKQPIIYKRINYFCELLNTMTLRKDCYDLPFISMVNTLKLSTKQKTLRGIKKYLKKVNMQIYNKYIYLIYYKLYDIKLVNISNNQLNHIIFSFKEYDRVYRTSNKRNQSNYNFIFYKLFEEQGIPTKYLLMPRTIDKLNNDYNLLYNSI